LLGPLSDGTMLLDLWSLWSLHVVPPPPTSHHAFFAPFWLCFSPLACLFNFQIRFRFAIHRSRFRPRFAFLPLKVYTQTALFAFWPNGWFSVYLIDRNVGQEPSLIRRLLYHRTMAFAARIRSVVCRVRPILSAGQKGRWKSRGCICR